MSTREHAAGLSIDPELKRFVDEELLPHAGLRSDEFWAGFGEIVHDLMPTNRRLLAERERFQQEIDAWHDRHGQGTPREYRAFLERLGYLLPAPPLTSVRTDHVDAEVAEKAGPQLVVPVSNARYALNAVNARWGSLYDALYGSDVIPGAPRSEGYDRERGRQVVGYVRALLDEFFPLEDGTFADVTGFLVEGRHLVARLGDRGVRLSDRDAFAGYGGNPAAPTSIVLTHHGLRWEIRIDRNSPVGRDDAAGIADVLVESALTTIIDFEDSTSAVDAADKVAAYRNWLGLNRGDLAVTFDKGGRPVTRRLKPDRVFVSRDGDALVLPGRALMFVRNVGHLMTTDAVLDRDHEEIGEGLLDAVITSLAALPGRDAANPLRNGAQGSIYIVKPKMHGPEEVGFTDQLFTRVEGLLGLPRNTIKLGLMDEERRTSLNLAASVLAAPDRVVFINTGFLDRSGDEIHTSMRAGAMVRKKDMARQPWIMAYEAQNVDVGLRLGLSGRGQIGKGMWAMPDLMSAMLEEKIAHPAAGASTAWVPSPTAATLHALHYHRVDVWREQRVLMGKTRSDDLLESLMTIPLAHEPLGADERREELESNIQSLLGYVVRWIDQGVGCSKVPDLHGVGLMEDRATLRISSQLLANWLFHGVITESEVLETMARMAAVVDSQNETDAAYRPMSHDLDGNIAYLTAKELILTGASQPNGYTEPILHRRRREAKKRDAAVVAAESVTFTM